MGSREPYVDPDDPGTVIPRYDPRDWSTSAVVETNEDVPTVSLPPMGTSSEECRLLHASPTRVELDVNCPRLAW